MKEQQIGNKGMNRRPGLGLALKALCLGAMAASLPGAGQAADGLVGSSGFWARTINDAFGQPFVIAEKKDTFYGGSTGCAIAWQSGTLNQTPYIVVFPGDTGNFGNTDPGNTTRNGYYEGVLFNEARVLSDTAPCVRVVAVETSTAYTGYAAYPITGFAGANLSGSPAVYTPMTRGATAEFAITKAIQSDPKYSAAQRWYLHGGSAGAMNAARMIDMLTDSAVSANNYRIPEAVLLESLPISGDMYKVCQNANPASLVYYIIGRDYGSPGICTTVASNPPTLYDYKVFSANMRNWYLNAKGKRINVMMGADDPIWKGALSNWGWAALGDYKNFLATIGASTAGCASSAYAFDPSHETLVFNSDMWADCESGRLRIRQFQFGGHGPLANSAVGTHPYGTAANHLRAWVQ